MIFDGGGLLCQEINVAVDDYTNNNNNNNNNNDNTRNGNNNRNNNNQEENEDLDIVSTQVDYHLDVNNIQVKDGNIIIREYDGDGSNSIKDEVNGDDVNNNNAAANYDGENDSDSTIYTYLAQTTVQKSSTNSITPTTTTATNND